VSRISASEARKQELIAAGATYRKAVGEARQQVKTGLQGESLARKTIGQLALTAVAAFKSRKSASLMTSGARTLLPLLVSGISMLAKKKAVKPAIRKVLVAGAVGTIIAVLAKRKFSRWRGTSAKESRAKRRM
jgi:uncharacterized YccA/Bax inhibitor family protein